MDTKILFHKIAVLESEKGNLVESNGRLQSRLDTYNDYLLPRATEEAKEFIDNHQFSKVTIVPSERLKSLNYEIQRLQEKCGEIPRKTDEEKKKPINAGYVMRVKDFYAFPEHFQTLSIECMIDTVPLYTVRFEDGMVDEFNEFKLGKTKEEVQKECDKFNNDKDNITTRNRLFGVSQKEDTTPKRKFNIGDVVLCHRFIIGGGIVISENGFHDKRYLDTSYFNRKAFISNTYKQCMEQHGEENPEDKDEYKITFLDNVESLAWVSGDDLTLLLKN